MLNNFPIRRTLTAISRLLKARFHSQAALGTDQLTAKA